MCDCKDGLQTCAHINPKSRVKTNYEAVYYRQTHLMNVLSDIKNWNLTWARYMFSDIRTYIPAYGYIMWLEVMHETEEPICIGNSVYVSDVIGRRFEKVQKRPYIRELDVD
jgi:hypothetical protein